MNLTFIMTGIVAGSIGAGTAIFSGYSFWIALAIYSGLGTLMTLVAILAGAIYCSLHARKSESELSTMQNVVTSPR